MKIQFYLLDQIYSIFWLGRVKIVLFVIKIDTISNLIRATFIPILQITKIMSETNKQQTSSPKPEQSSSKQESKSSHFLIKHAEQFQTAPPQGYKFIETIGDGSFGKVKLGIHTMTGEKVAIKILCKDRIRQRTDIERISRQIKIMKLVRHPFIVQMYEIIESPKYLFLVMEYIEGGDLFDQISNASKLSEDRCKKIFSQIVLGLQYLHGIGITHRDMKPQNILMESTGVIKIADFGLGNFFSGDQKLKTACGSPCYAPPQMLNQQQYNPRKVDIWSSGVILYAMVHGYLPFEDDVTSLLYEKIKTKNVRVASWVSIPCRNLLRGLLAKSQTERWDIDIIKKHEFLYESIQAQQDYVNKLTSQINLNEFHSICDHLGIMEQQRLLNNLKKNKHNNLTTLYYLGKKKYLREKDQISEIQKEQQSLISEEMTQPLPQLPNKNMQEDNRNLYSFSQKSEPMKPEQERPNQDTATKRMDEQLNKTQKMQDSVQPHVAVQVPSPIQMRQSVIQPREPPQQIIQTPIIESIKESIALPQKKQKQEPITKDTKPQRPATKSFQAQPAKRPPTAHVTENIKKSQKIQKNINKAENKGLKKSERMPIYKPKQQANKLNESQVKLYQRSHSKDRPIMLKNNLKTQLSMSRGVNERNGSVTGKIVHIEPHLLDIDRIVLCSGERFIEILEKRGFNGRIQYFNYQKQAIYLAKVNLKNKNTKGINPTFQKLVMEINQGY